MYNLRDAVVMFNGETGEVLVTEKYSSELLDRRDLPSCDWANEDYWASISAEEMHYRMYQEFHYLTMFQRVDPQAAHREFCKINEYQAVLPRDCPDHKADVVPNEPPLRFSDV